jgi:hypothetical protein
MSIELKKQEGKKNSLETIQAMEYAKTPKGFELRGFVYCVFKMKFPSDIVTQNIFLS